MKISFLFSPRIGFFLMLGLTFLSYSCAKDGGNELNYGDGNVTIDVSTAKLQLDDLQDVVLSKSDAGNKAQAIVSDPVRISDKYSMVAEITPVNSLNISTSNIVVKDGNRAATKVVESISAVDNYVLFAFDGDNLVETVGGTVNTEGLLFQKSGLLYKAAAGKSYKLDGGRTYTFVALAIMGGTSTDIMSAELNSGSTLSLSTMRAKLLTNQTLSNNVLVWKSQVQMPSSGPQNFTLPVVFRSTAVGLQVELDASAMGLGVLIDPALLKVKFSNTRVNGQYIFGSGVNYFANTTLDSRLLAFDGVQSANIVKSNLQYYYFPTETITDFMTLENLKVGSDTKVGPIHPFSGSSTTLKVGYRYNVKLKISPSRPEGPDTIGDIPVITIGDYTWMQHNLGADYTINPYDSVSYQNSNIFGHYYQWGKITPVIQNIKYSDHFGNPSSNVAGNTNGSLPLPPTAFNSRAGYYNNWVLDDNGPNSGSVEVPIKRVTNDPCPPKFRTPTRIEIENLVASIEPDKSLNNTPQYPASTGRGQFAPKGYLMLKSKANPNVKIAFPRQGIGAFDNYYFMGIGNNLYGYYLQTLMLMSSSTFDAAFYNAYPRYFKLPYTMSNLPNSDNSLKVMGRQASFEGGDEPMYWRMVTMMPVRCVYDSKAP